MTIIIIPILTFPAVRLPSPTVCISFTQVKDKTNYLNLVRSNLDNKTITQSLSDSEGLKRASESDQGIYTFVNRMHTAGTRSLNDVADDV